MKRANLWDGGSSWGEFIIRVGFVDTGEHDTGTGPSKCLSNFQAS